MFPAESVVIIVRALERLLIVVGGLMGMYLGYRLFYLTTKSKSSAEVKGQTVRLKLSDIGPGIFFCGFGVSLLAYSLFKPVEVISSSGNSTKRIHAAIAPPPSSIGMVDYFDIESLLPTLVTNTSQSSISIQQSLRLLQFKILSNQYGEDFAQWFNQMRQTEVKNPKLFQEEFSRASQEWQLQYKAIVKDINNLP